MYSNNLCFYACETHYFHLSSAIQATATDSYAQLKTKFEKHEINTLVDIELCNIQYNLLILDIFYSFSSGFRIQAILTRSGIGVPHLVLLTELSTGRQPLVTDQHQQSKTPRLFLQRHR